MKKKKPFIIISLIGVAIIVFTTILRPHTKTIFVSSPSSTQNHEQGSLHDTINLKVFLENSGSMDGYMAPGSHLKDAIYDYVSDLADITDTIGLYYINSRIIQQTCDLDTYINNITPSSFAVAGGSRSNTDIGQIVRSVLEETGQNDVSILVSDFILDLPRSDARHYLEQKSIQIKNAFKEKLNSDPDFAVIILRMVSNFSGTYFYPNGNREHIDNKLRPYYIWIVGNKNKLAAIMRHAPFSEIKHGYTNYATYSSETEIPYTLSNLGNTSRTIKPQKGLYKILLRADFSPTLQPENIILNKQNYTFTSPTMAIEEINSITSDNETYTDYFIITFDDKTLPASTSIKFTPPSMPEWINSYNDETADSILTNLDKTTGIKSLIQGVSDAYNNQLISTEFIINISTKR